MASDKQTKNDRVVRLRPAWEARHENDAGGPLASNESELPDRSSRVADGSPGEVAPVHGDGFQRDAGAVHPDFPAASPGEATPEVDEAAIRERAHQIWEEEGSQEGGHERHWRQAEEELRKSRS